MLNHIGWVVSCNCCINRITGGDKYERRDTFLRITHYLVSIAEADSYVLLLIIEEKAGYS